MMTRLGREAGSSEEVRVPSYDLKAIPLFAGIPDEHLTQLLSRFRRDTLGAGETLFAEGSTGDRFCLLVDGEMEARTVDGTLAIHPFAPVGELGSLAGLRRPTTAVAVRPSEVLSIPRAELFEYFDSNGAIGFRFHDNLMHILADKLERDRERMEQMRANLVETQKAMKRMREALLESADTPLVRTLFEELDALIEHNRRGRYFIEVPRAVPLVLRLVADHAVRRISNERLVVEGNRDGETPLAAGAVIAGVLSAQQAQIPVSGTVESVSDAGIEITLDVLIDESADALERLLARLQLLDVIL